MKFDKIYAQWFAFLAVVAFAVAFPSFRASKTVVFDDMDGTSAVTYDPQGREDQIYKAWTLDTLTTTEADTLALGYTLASPYQFSYQIKCIKISGTPSLKVVSDQRNSLSNTDWQRQCKHFRGRQRKDVFRTKGSKYIRLAAQVKACRHNRG